MIGRGVPCAFEQLHSTEFLQCDAAPVAWRSGGTQSTAALSSVLIAQHPKFPFVVPAQPMRAKPSIMGIIGGANRTLIDHGRSGQLMAISSTVWIFARTTPIASTISDCYLIFNGINNGINNFQHGNTRPRLTMAASLPDLLMEKDHGLRLALCGICHCDKKAEISYRWERGLRDR